MFEVPCKENTSLTSHEQQHASDKDSVDDMVIPRRSSRPNEGLLWHTDNAMHGQNSVKFPICNYVDYSHLSPNYKTFVGHISRALNLFIMHKPSRTHDG